MLEHCALSDAQHEQQQQVLLSSLKELLNSKQQEMEELRCKLIETESALVGMEGRLKLQEAVAVTAQVSCCVSSACISV
jgi:hypothetical protein